MTFNSKDKNLIKVHCIKIGSLRKSSRYCQQEDNIWVENSEGKLAKIFMMTSATWKQTRGLSQSNIVCYLDWQLPEPIGQNHLSRGVNHCDRQLEPWG
jgi:hypothetical protein